MGATSSTLPDAPEKATLFDSFAVPLVRDWPILLAGLCLWFAVQLLTDAAASRWVSGFRRLPKKERRDWPVRMVAVVNGLVCSRSAYLFLTEAPQHRASLYDEMPAYRIPLALLVSYFMWDVIVCLRYRWGFAFTAHGVLSCVGMLLCAYPCSDGWSGYFAGVFELSNGFLHASAMLKSVNVLPRVATALDVAFAVLFFVIRIFVGTYATAKWTGVAVQTIQEGKAHNGAVLCVMVVMLWGIVALQYVWASTVAKAIKDAVVGAGDVAAAEPVAVAEQKEAAPLPPTTQPKPLAAHGGAARRRHAARE